MPSAAAPATVTLHDKQFRLYRPATELATAVRDVAARLTADYAGRRPLFVVVLNGAFIFAADLVRATDLPEAPEITFVKLASYEGTSSSGTVSELMGLREDVAGRHVIIIEDIVDTGHTAAGLLATLQQRGAVSVEVACLLLKPAALQAKLTVRYVGLAIPNDFVVGYGLDYDGLGRHLPDLYQAIA